MITLAVEDTLQIKPETRQLGIYKFGEDNLYPNNNKTLAYNSSALFTAWNTFADFVYGQGMTTEKNFWKRKINIYGLRIDQLARRIIEDYAIHKGFAVKIVYNAELERVQYIPIDFANCRLAISDDFGKIVKVKYCKDWSARIDKKNPITEYDVFTTDKDTIKRQIEAVGGIENWNGHIYYFGKNGELAYPHCFFHSVLEDVATDIELKKGKNADVYNNFMASHAIILPYTFKDIAKGTATDAKEIEKLADEMQEDFQSKIAEFCSAKKKGKMMLMQNPLRDKEGKIIPIEIKKFDLQNYDGMHEKTENSIRSNVRECYLLPEILVKAVSTGFSTEIMQSYYNFYNNITAKHRQIFEEFFMLMFEKDLEGIEFSLKPLKYL